MSESQQKVVLYQAPGRGVKLEVRLERDTLWLPQKEIALLFATERSVITKHLGNIFATKELGKGSNVQKMHVAGSDRPVAFYSLDAIISVGYRVNSRRGTQFRIWATRVLRERLLQGQIAPAQPLQELNQAIRMIADVARRHEFSGDEAQAILRVVTDYAGALDLLDGYDNHRITIRGTTRRPARTLDVVEARRIVAQLRVKFGASRLFGREKDENLGGALAAITQTFGGRDVYPSLEEKAAHLIYFLVKSHPFVDGNKRIAAALFLWFLEKNGALYRADGTKRIADNALVAMTLLIAESQPTEKDILARVVVNLINRRNA